METSRCVILMLAYCLMLLVSLNWSEIDWLINNLEFCTGPSESFIIDSSVQNELLSEFRQQINGQHEQHPWRYIGLYNGVESYVKNIPGSKLLTFRGVTVIDLHISQAMGPFANVSRSLDYIPLLKSIRKYPIDSNSPMDHSELEYDDNIDILHQVLNMPWPMTPRDILLRREFRFHENNGSAEIVYSSTEDDRIPVPKGSLRVHSPHTSWKFQVVQSPVLSETIGAKQPSNNQSKCDCSQSSKPVKSSIDACNALNSNINCTGGSSDSKTITKAGRGRLSLLSKVKSSRLFRGLSGLVRRLFGSLKSGIRFITGGQRGVSTDSSHQNVGDSSHQACSTDCVTYCAAQEGALKLKATAGFNATGSTDSVNSNKPASAAVHYTRVEIECVVDSKGSVPAWFVHFMQRRWPGATISLFGKLVRRGAIAPHPRVLHW